MSMTPPYRPGDVVRHQHTGEQWVVAYADPETGRLGWCGWPQGEASIANCTLVRAASDAESADIRASLVGTGGQRSATVARLYPMGEPVAPDTWEWWAGPDDESLTIGPCPTREAAITQAVSEGLTAVHVVETVQRPIDLGAAFGADVAIERMEECLEEEHGDGNGDWLTHAVTWTPEHRADLERRLTHTVRDWQAAHGIVLKPWQFSAMRNAERIEIPAKSSSPSPVPSSALPQVVSPSA